MKERPILFSAPMVRALLNGKKTQTRRIVKPQPERNDKGTLMWGTGRRTGLQRFGVDGLDVPPGVFARCPYGQPGDRLWVRESGAMHALLAPEDPAQPWLFRHDVPATANLGQYWVQRTRAPGASYSTECTREHFLHHSGSKVVPSIHMPRWASRITLEVTNLRVERLQDISAADALAEGVNVHSVFHDKPATSLYSPVQAYRDLWEQINGPDSWEANPWVWVVEFKRLP